MLETMTWWIFSGKDCSPCSMLMTLPYKPTLLMQMIWTFFWQEIRLSGNPRSEMITTKTFQDQLDSHSRIPISLKSLLFSWNCQHTHTYTKQNKVNIFLMSSSNSDPTFSVLTFSIRKGSLELPGLSFFFYLKLFSWVSFNSHVSVQSFYHIGKFSSKSFFL